MVLIGGKRVCHQHQDQLLMSPEVDKDVNKNKWMSPDVTNWIRKWNTNPETKSNTTE